MKRLVFFGLSFYFILLLIIPNSIFANGDDGENDGDKNEFGEIFGIGATGLLGVGSIYIFIRRGVIWYGQIKSKNEELSKSMKNLFARYRPQLLMMDQIFMVLATIFAIIHGLSVERKSEDREIFGWAAASLMIILSLLGILMWNQLRPFLKKVDLYTPIRFIHRQWILLLFLTIFLIIHVSL